MDKVDKKLIQIRKKLVAAVSSRSASANGGSQVASANATIKKLAKANKIQIHPFTFKEGSNVITSPVNIKGKFEQGVFACSQISDKEKISFYGDSISAYLTTRTPRESLMLVGRCAQFVGDGIGMKVSTYGFNMKVGQKMKNLHNMREKYLRKLERSSQMKTSIPKYSEFEHHLYSGEFYSYINNLVMYNCCLIEDAPIKPNFLTKKFFSTFSLEQLVKCLDFVSIVPVEKQESGKIIFPGRLTASKVNLAVGAFAGKANSKFTEEGGKIILKATKRISEGEQVILPRDGYGHEYKDLDLDTDSMEYTKTQIEQMKFRLKGDFAGAKEIYLREEFILTLHTIKMLKQIIGNMASYNLMFLTDLVEYIKTTIDPNEIAFNRIYNTEEIDEVLKITVPQIANADVIQRRSTNRQSANPKPGTPLLVLSKDEWWPCMVVPSHHKEKVKLLFLRDDLRKNQINLFGSMSSVKLGKDFSEEIRSPNKTLGKIKKEGCNNSFCMLNCAINWESTDTQFQEVYPLEMIKDIQRKAIGIRRNVKKAIETVRDKDEEEQMLFVRNKIQEQSGTIYDFLKTSPFNSFNVSSTVSREVSATRTGGIQIRDTRVTNIEPSVPRNESQSSLQRVASNELNAFTEGIATAWNMANDGASVWDGVRVFSDTQPPRERSINVVNNDDVIDSNLVSHPITTTTTTTTGGPEIEVMDEEETDEEEDEIVEEPVEKKFSEKMIKMNGKGYYVNGLKIHFLDSKTTGNNWYRTLVLIKEGRIVVNLYSIETKKMKKKMMGHFMVQSEKQFWAELEKLIKSNDVYMKKAEMPSTLQEQIWGCSKKRGHDSSGSSGSSSKKAKSCVHNWQPISFPDGTKFVVCKHCNEMLKMKC